MNTANSAAAQSARPGAGHLDEVDAGERTDDLPGREVHVVVATQVARVVEGDPLVEGGVPKVQASGLDELHEELGVVDDFVVPAELRVFVLQGVEAVRALRDDL